MTDKLNCPTQGNAVADAKQRKKVLVCNRKVDGSSLPSLSNMSDIPLVFLPGHDITSKLFLTCTILVPGQTIIRVPALCCALARTHAVRGGPVFPPTTAIGWVACGLYEWTLDLFGHAETCKAAGWQRRLSVCSSLGFTPAREEVQSFVNLVCRVDFERVKSITPSCSDWVATGRGVRVSALFFRKRFVHLHILKTL
jgi:hypothetical protein